MALKVLLTGGTGRVGAMFQHVAGNDLHVSAPSRRDLDLLRPASLTAAVAATKPDWVVHAAAMTDVDGCERQAGLARKVNVAATAALAEAAARHDARFLLVSTDYVFDGRRGDYKETDQPNPISVYGKTKLEAEKEALTIDPDTLVVRSSVLFGTPGHPDFVSWVADRLRASPRLRVAAQRASPTSTRDLCQQMMALMEKRARGIYHAAGADALSRRDMALAIAHHLGMDASIDEIPLSEMPWAARRPADSSLNVEKMRTIATPCSFADELGRALKS